MTITLTPEQQIVIERNVRSGRFATREEAMQAAISHLEQEASVSDAEADRLRELRSKSLYELMQESPLYGNEVEFERDRSSLRDIDL